jgi:hypothetical protein
MTRHPMWMNQEARPTISKRGGRNGMPSFSNPLAQIRSMPVRHAIDTVEAVELMIS